MSFETSFTNLLGWEGGYSNNAKDPGGATNLGVIQSEYDAHRTKKGLPHQPVKQITLAEAEEIYRAEYWDATLCGELDPGVANCLFDADVNSGDRRGVAWLQQAINQLSGHRTVVPVDGKAGAATVAAANALAADELIDAMLTLRLAFMHVAKNPKTGALLWPTFGTGWSRRINGVRVQSHKLAGVEMAAAPIPSPTAIKEQTPMATATPSTSTISTVFNAAKTDLKSVSTAIGGIISSTGFAMLLGLFSHLMPGAVPTVVLVLGLAAGLVSTIAHFYFLMTGLQANNNATIALFENLLNSIETGLGGKPLVFDNGTPTPIAS